MLRRQIAGAGTEPLQASARKRPLHWLNLVGVSRDRGYDLRIAQNLE
jgi:hypothetical protein